MVTNPTRSNDLPNSTVHLNRLLDPSVFPHEVTKLEWLETHISWVILTGAYAYKIKKPITFDFVDYSTLERRKKFCHKELELNRRLAPDLYLDVVPIYEKNGELSIGKGLHSASAATDDVDTVEYAVKMVQFPQDTIVAGRLHHRDLRPAVVEQFGIDIAHFHHSIASVLPSAHHVSAEHIGSDALNNFTILHEAFPDGERLRTLRMLERWTSNKLLRLETIFDRRLNSGFVRCCHGDMHLKNMFQLDGRLVAFDGIEFNADFQWIDVMSEIAFPVMDFVARGRADLGWRLLNAYLEATGDYDGLQVLRFYLVYRAMVRAKVTWLNPRNHTNEAREKHSAKFSCVDELAGPWDKYLHAASYFAVTMKPSLSITHGFAGSGKSTAAIKLAEEKGGIRIRSDVERNRLSRQLQAPDKYSKEMTETVYDKLAGFTKTAITSHFPVIVDATFLKHDQRTAFEQLRGKSGIAFQILNCDAPFEELCQRITRRGSDASEATLDVLRSQMEAHEPLTTSELQFIITPEHSVDG